MQPAFLIFYQHARVDIIFITQTAEMHRLLNEEQSVQADLPRACVSVGGY